MLYSITRKSLYGVFKIFFGLTITGREAIPQQGAFILAANHESNFDPPVIGASCRRPLYFLAKRELFRYAVCGAYLWALHARPLTRHSSDIGALRQAVSLLRSGKSIALFPQGTRGGDLERAKQGVGFLVVRTGVPVIAARIEGTRKAFPKGAWLPRLSRITVSFVRVDIPSSCNRREITERVVQALK